MKKFNFRKIASVLTSAVMLSSTVALAAAANYPAPFVSGGKADVAVVYGANAMITDVAAVVDITADLQAKLAGQTATGGTTTSGTTVSGGDYVKLAKPSDNINLGNSLSTVFGSSISDDDLPELLMDGTYSNDENSDYDYEQTLALGGGLILEYFQDSDYNERVPAVGINLTTNQVILNYTLDFTDEPQSDVSSSDLVDLETTTIKILGKEYYISDFDNISATGTGTITLLDTANSEIVKEGETKTVQVGDKTYDVFISTISGAASAPQVKMSVNGQTTNSLSAGGTYKLSDGTYVGIKDISIRDVAGNVGSVEFSLGSGKLELRGGQSIKINDDTVQDITSEIKRGSGASGGRETVDRINLVWMTQEDEFVTPETELDMPGFVNLKISMSKFISGDEVTKIEDGASDYLQIRTTLKDGDVTIPVLYADSGGEISGVGKSTSERLVTSNNTANTVFNYTAGDRYFVGSWNTSSDAESYYMRFTSFQNDNGVNKTTIEKYDDGAWVETCGRDKKAGDTCSIGSLTLTIGTVSPHPDRAVNFSGNAGSSFNTLYTKSGLRLTLPFAYAGAAESSLNSTQGALNITSNVPGHNSSSFTFFLRGEDRTDTLGGGTLFHVNTTSNTDNEIELSNVYTGRTLYTDPEDSNHLMSRVYTDVSSLVERNGQSSDQRKITVTYGGSDSYADIILTAKGATVTSGSGGTGSGTVSVLGSVAVSDSEASSVSGRNLVVVGGSCINSVAASLLGGAYCGADFTAQTGVGSGSFLIQTFSRSGGKVATLVAGYNAPDTTNAAKFLVSKTVDTTVGKKYKGSSATSADLVTTASTGSADVTELSDSEN